MKISDLIAALDLPAAARVDQRVPKKLLLEYGAPTVADKRRINEGIEDVQWLAALKPTTIGVPAFRDGVREYLEIAVLSATLRPGAKESRLTELTHRAVPYPVLLISTLGDALSLSVAHKRRSHGEAGATVVDEELIVADLGEGHDARFDAGFIEALPLARQPRLHLYALYGGWMDTTSALLAARMTGEFTIAESPEHSTARRNALSECARLEVEMRRLRAAAAREKQVARQVALNVQLKHVQAEHANVRARL